MVSPRVFVYAFSYLRKCLQILRAQVELAVRSTEVKALVFTQFSGCIFAAVTAKLCLCGLYFYFCRLWRLARTTRQLLRRLLGWIGQRLRPQLLAGACAELLDYSGWVGPDSD